MTFNRTPAGMSAQRFFYRVDIIVYCEGSNNDPRSATFDELFWKKILSNYGITCEPKSIGSKNELRKMLLYIVENKITHNIIASDRDYDNYNCNVHFCKKYIRTLGYSWESDTISLMSFNNVASLFLNSLHYEKLQIQFDEYVEMNKRVLQLITAIDINYIFSTSSLFDRNKPLSIILQSETHAPSINISKILKAAATIIDTKSTTINLKAAREIDGMREFFGKTIAHLVHLWFKHQSLSTPKRRNVNYETFISAAISSITINRGCLEDLYYTDAIAKLEYQ